MSIDAAKQSLQQRQLLTELLSDKLSLFVELNKTNTKEYLTPNYLSKNDYKQSSA